jgi:hypothetical protein
MYNIDTNNIMNTRIDNINPVNENDAMIAHINDFNIWLEGSIKRRENQKSLENFNNYKNVGQNNKYEFQNNSYELKSIIDVDNITEKDFNQNNIILQHNQKIIDEYKKRICVNEKKIYFDHQIILYNYQKFFDNQVKVHFNEKENNNQQIYINNYQTYVNYYFDYYNKYGRRNI